MWFSNQWDKITRAFEPQADEDEEAQRGIPNIEILWGRERLSVSLPPTGSISQPHTLYNLKKQISEITSIPIDEQKLVYHGLILKDLNASLRSYNIRSGSRVMLVGSVGDKPGDKVSSNFGGQGSNNNSTQPTERHLTKGELLAEERKRKEADRSEEGVSARIQEVLDGVQNDLKPQLDEFQRYLTGQAQQQQQQQDVNPPQPAPAQTHRVLNELFSRALLSLDAIPTVSDATRQKRKDAVRAVQAYIDQLDQAWDARGDRK